jgi:spore maturation protein CgeB
VISDQWDGMETFFQPGKEIFTVSSAADVDNVLSMDAAQVRGLADRARQRALDEHTADHRGATLLRELEAAA